MNCADTEEFDSRVICGKENCKCILKEIRTTHSEVLGLRNQMIPLKDCHPNWKQERVFLYALPETRACRRCIITISHGKGDSPLYKSIRIT
jgi:hypothetical protein